MKSSPQTKLAMIVIAAFAVVLPVLAQIPAFTEFKFMSERIGWEDDLTGIIDDGAKTVTFTTQKWVENIAELNAVFELNGNYQVKVDGTLQTSGVTKNDFRKDVIYRINDDVDYTIKFVSPQATGLPVIRIDTKNGAPILDRENYVNMTLALTDADNPSNNITVVNSTDGIRGRGNSTWSGPKRPYRIKFDKKQSLFGLPAAKSYVLLAEAFDPTLIKNTVAFELGNRLGLQYNHTYHHVELYVNGTYKGHYTLTEHNQVGQGRVDIDENEGWMVELDKRNDEEPIFRTTNLNLQLVIKSPEFEPADMSNSMYDFVRDDWNELTDLMASASFPENGYRDLINMETIVKYLLVPVLTQNYWDFLKNPAASCFFYKDKGGKISGGPLWDFDLSLGSGWVWNEVVPGRYGGGYNDTPYPTNDKTLFPFWALFFQDPEFRVMYKETWKNNIHQISSMPQFIDDMSKKIRKSAVENYKTTWQNGLDFDDWIQFTKNYLINRINYLDIVYNKVDVLPENKTFTTQVFGYSDAAPQTFTFVSYGDMTDLSATLKKGDLSDFEISAGLNKTPTGNGGYLATINVKPKISLPAGTYTETLVLSGSNQGKSFSLNVPLTFVVKEIPDNVVFPVFSEPIVYSPTRTLSEIELNGSGDGNFAWEYSSIVPSVNISTYNVIFVPKDTAKYISLSKFVELTVEKADPPHTLSYGALTAVYGTALADVTLPDGWEWENTGTVGNAGTSPHTARVIPSDLDNYNIIENISLPVIVLPKDIAGATVDVGGTYTYTGMEQTPPDDSVSVRLADFEPAYDIAVTDNINAGEATLTVTGIGNFTGTATGTFLIGKASYDMSGITFADKNVEYSGNEHSILIDGELPSGVNVTYSGNSQTEVGDYTIIAAFAVKDPDNYNVPPEMTAELFISKPNSVLTPNRVIPTAKPGEEATVIAPVTVLPGEFTAGPNPISKQSGIVNFYRQGRRIANSELRIYDAIGNIINKVKINDKVLSAQARRKVGAWDLKDAKGRPVPEGTYLVKGVIKTSDGKNEKVSVILSVR